MSDLCKRLQIGETLVSSAPQEQLDALRSEVEVPINGASWYLVQGLLPSFETVYFQQVVDAAGRSPISPCPQEDDGRPGRSESGR